MNIVASECTVKKHHPEWSNVSLIHLTPGGMFAHDAGYLGL
jgi:hypothetical protein